MPPHEYTATRALEILLKKIEERDSDLARHVRSAIDAGKDVEEREPSRRRRKRPRVYRKAVRLTDEEALRVALDVLQAYFVEQPLFVNSAAENFRAAAVAARSPSQWIGEERKDLAAIREGVDSEKVLEIELQAETQISRSDRERLQLQPVTESTIQEQRMNVERLCKLFEFGSR